VHDRGALGRAQRGEQRVGVARGARAGGAEREDAREREAEKAGDGP